MDASTTSPGGRNCTQPAIEDFPRDLFSDEERAAGAFVIHVFISLYLFAALAVVCDKFFVPAVDRICQALQMSNDVAGATFMAAATSAPELFVNVIGTFITEGDIGVGTIVGSAVFNILAVAACCGMCAGMVVPLDWWPLTRDCLAYGITVSILICIIHDERVEWYEALTLVLLYGLYIFIMYHDKSFQRCARGGFRNALCINSRRSNSNTYSPSNSETIEARLPLRPMNHVFSADHQQHNGSVKLSLEAAAPAVDPAAGDSPPAPPTKGGKNEAIRSSEVITDNPEGKKVVEYKHSLLKWPAGRGCLTQTTWIVTWPIHLIFMFTIPDCEKPRFKKWFPMTFLMCIVWIGSLSYIVAWMITIIGDTLKIPDSVMGITFLAAGTSVPEAVSSVIVAKQGHGSMGISNSIGSNTFDILLCLGLPWLIKAAFIPTEPGHHWVAINSTGLEYSAISLLSTLLMLYVTFSYNKFVLDARVGRVCLCMYAVFLVLATLIELNVFFQVNLPPCSRAR